MISAEGERNGLLLERDRELERIRRCLQRAHQGHGGALVVEGPAGIGKTVLLAAARDMAGREGFRVLRARGAELEREFAFGVVRQLVEPVVAGASEEERAGLLEGPPGVAARLLGLPGLGDALPEGTPVAPDPSFAVLHGLYWLCANLAAEGPLALVVDDAHWADGASLRFLAFLLPRLEELALAVVLGARLAEAGQSQELLAALTMDPATELVTVAPLTTRGVATLVAASMGAEPEPAFAAACWEATGGTPFLVRTLIEALREERIAPVAASAGEVANIATATLGRWAMLRLARLGPDAAGLARAVAILERAEVSQAARLAGLDPLDGARAAQLLIRAGVLVEAPLCFAHPLLRAAVYREIPVDERAEGHGRAAGCWPKHTPARPGWPSTCWPPPRRATPGWSNSYESPPTRPPPGGRRSRGPPTCAGPRPSRHRPRREPTSCSSSVGPSSTPASRAGTATSKRRWRRPPTI